MDPMTSDVIVVSKAPGCKNQRRYLKVISMNKRSVSSWASVMTSQTLFGDLEKKYKMSVFYVKQGLCLYILFVFCVTVKLQNTTETHYTLYNS